MVHGERSFHINLPTAQPRLGGTRWDLVPPEDHAACTKWWRAGQIPGLGPKQPSSGGLLTHCSVPFKYCSMFYFYRPHHPYIQIPSQGCAWEPGVPLA